MGTEDEGEVRFTREEAIAGVAAMAVTKFAGDARAHRDLLARARALRGKRDCPPNLRRLGSEIPTAERRTIERTATDVARVIKSATEQLFESAAAESSLDDTRTTYPIAPEQLAVLVMATRGKEKNQADLAPLIEACGSDATRLNYAMSYLQWTFEDTPEEQLGRALLPVVVADFEALLAALVRLWLTLYPEALGVDQKQLTVAQARAMRSVEDLVRQKVDERVSAFVDGGPAEWDRVMSRSLGIQLRRLERPWASMVEVLARRNAIIHAGGRVDQRYLRQARLKGDQPHLGSPLTCSPEYVFAAIDAFERLGQVLAVELLCRLTPRSQFAVEVAANQVFLALSAEHWAEARQIAVVALDHLPPDCEAHELRVNYWMARRELGDRWDDLRAEIEAWEPPDGKSQYVLAKAALLGDEEGAVRALERCEREGPPLRIVAGWPLIVQMCRQSQRVAKIVNMATRRASRSREAPIRRSRARR